MAVKKALVLSGGGGRGAYHIGAIAALIKHGWMEDGKGPDIIAGTSIGAINAAALASGLTIAQLTQRWLAMNTEHVHQLSPDLPAVARPMLRLMLKNVLTSEGHERPSAPPASDDPRTTINALERLGSVFQMHPFHSLLDTTPWRRTLGGWMDFPRINSPAAPALLLAATEVRSGALQIFCNRARNGRAPDQIALDHLMASSSIPIVYPSTTIGDGVYWDGAVLANTPLGAIVDLAGDDDLDIVVVLMTPWNEDVAARSGQLQTMPQDLVQSLTLTLDWALLASYRAAIKQMRTYNKLAQAAAQLERAAALTGDTSLLPEHTPRYIREPLVIAPQELMPLEWIVDYERANHEHLFALGDADATRALAGRAAGKAER